MRLNIGFSIDVSVFKIVPLCAHLLYISLIIIKKYKNGDETQQQKIVWNGNIAIS